MIGQEATSVETLARAAAIGRAAGLRFVYGGNRPGQMGELENTACPGCRALLVERIGFRVLRNRVTGEGNCPHCGMAIPGIWHAVPPARQEEGTQIHIRCG
jgi:pyruvate formate lyase activating enzyme